MVNTSILTEKNTKGCEKIVQYKKSTKYKRCNNGGNEDKKGTRLLEKNSQ